jgi:uncharacterized membrane-anchored protein YhcB (DUF1043 family)
MPLKKRVFSELNVENKPRVRMRKFLGFAQEVFWEKRKERRLKALVEERLKLEERELVVALSEKEAILSKALATDYSKLKDHLAMVAQGLKASTEQGQLVIAKANAVQKSALELIEQSRALRAKPL